MMFEGSTATSWSLLSKKHFPAMTTSTVYMYKNDFQLLQKALKVHSTYIPRHSFVKLLDPYGNA